MNPIFKNMALPLLLAGFVSGCSFSGNKKETTDKKCEDIKAELLQATLYHQTAGEYWALAYQAFQTAQLQLDKMLQHEEIAKPLAVVVDIDETVLDNSPFEAKSILNNATYPEYWAEWCQKGAAKPIPGALDFLNNAANKGVEVFYISNRHDSLRIPTVKNLKNAGFPFADKGHVLLKTTTSDKSARRTIVAEKYEIALLIGDNLGDFSQLFQKKSVEERKVLVDNYREQFGRKFIILPNAMYGEWEGAVIDYDYGKSKQEKRKDRIQALRSFD
jgi:5'-nucleotidase (lipoprotein e(P4) family)